MSNDSAYCGKCGNSIPECKCQTQTQRLESMLLLMLAADPKANWNEFLARFGDNLQEVKEVTLLEVLGSIKIGTVVRLLDAANRRVNAD